MSTATAATNSSPRPARLGTGFLAEVVVGVGGGAAAGRGCGLRVPRIRTGIVLAGEGGALERLARLCRFGVLGKLGDGRQWMSWISLRDEVAAIRYLLDPACEITGPVNLTAPGPVTNAVFTKALGRVLHRPTVLPIPSFGPKLLLGTELAEALLYDGQRVASRCAASTPGSSSATPTSNPPCATCSADACADG